MHVHVYGICSDKSQEYVCTYVGAGRNVMAAYVRAMRDARQTNRAHRYMDYTARIAHDDRLVIEGEPASIQ